jgi:hypothetical protein
MSPSPGGGRRFRMTLETYSPESVDEDVILEGSVFPSPIKGREGVRNAIRQSSRLYDRLEFTHETQSSDRTYFEWEGAAFGLPVWG